MGAIADVIRWGNCNLRKLRPSCSFSPRVYIEKPLIIDGIFDEFRGQETTTERKKVRVIKQKTTVKEIAKKADTDAQKKVAKKKDEDPFVAALIMAIENDGKIDKKELKHLKKLERQSLGISKPKRKKKRIQHSFRFHYKPLDNGFRLNITCTSKKKKAKKKKKKEEPKFEVNHVLREAFKMAALDGVVNASEVKQLKKLY
jgi:uncharacterized tellurite resistance protein B-like protein